MPRDRFDHRLWNWSIDRLLSFRDDMGSGILKNHLHQQVLFFLFNFSSFGRGEE